MTSSSLSWHRAGQAFSLQRGELLRGSSRSRLHTMAQRHLHWWQSWLGSDMLLQALRKVVCCGTNSLDACLKAHGWLRVRGHCKCLLQCMDCMMHQAV